MSAYIKSQTKAGWVSLPEHYNDGDFTGGNTALQPLRCQVRTAFSRESDTVVAEAWQVGSSSTPSG